MGSMAWKVLTGEQFFPHKHSEAWEFPRLSSSRPNKDDAIWGLVENCWGEGDDQLRLNEICCNLEEHASKWDPSKWQSLTNLQE